MVNSFKKLNNIIIFILIIALCTIFFANTANAKLENEEQIKEELQKENDENPSSTKYLVTDKYISCVNSETTIEDFKSNVQGVKVYETMSKEKEVTEGIIKTGMIAEYTKNGRTYNISVIGDLNKDGVLNQIDITREIRAILGIENWKIEEEIVKISADILRDTTLDEKDVKKGIDLIVLDKEEENSFEMIEKPEIDIIGEYKEDRYITEVKIKILQKDKKGEKTVYKITGAKDEAYREVTNAEEINLKEDGVYKITAYTYGKDGNKSEEESIIFAIEKEEYTVRYLPGTQGIFQEEIISGLYKGEKTPSFTKEIIGNEGYTFAGWSEKVSETVEGNKDYVAQWTANKYTIKYNLDGGTLEAGKTNPTIYTVETESFTLNNPGKVGYTFAGWTGSNGEEPEITVTIEQGNIGNKTYTANWKANTDTKYIIETYEMDLNGEYVKVNTEEKAGETDTEVSAEIITKEGFTYEESLSTPNGTIAPDGSTVLKVYYSRNKYTLSVANGIGIENATGAGNYYYGATVTINAEVKPGYTWRKWTSNSEKIQESTDKEHTITIPAENVTLTAKTSINTYTITYDLAGGNIQEEANPGKYTVETESFTLNNPSKVGYTFAGWTGSNGEEPEITVTIEQGSIENKTYTANWKANTDTKYIIETYEMDLNGEYVKVNTEEKAGETDTEVSAEIITKEGFTYEESLSTPNGTIAPDGSTVLKVYYSRNKYTLSVANGIGIENATGAGNYYYGATVTINAEVKPGYTWSKWTSSNTSLIADSTSKTYNVTIPAEDVILTANGTINTYTITYDLTGGALETGKTNPATYTVETESFTLNNPRKVGYTFVGWTGSNVTSANKTVTIEQGSTGDKTYTANWTANTDTKYTVETYEMNLNGEYVKVNTEEKAGETDTEVSAEIITKEGFTYEESLSTPNGTIAPDGSTVLKVYYSRNKYTLSVANGIGIENATGAGNYYYGATVTINAEVKPGYTWSKWTSSNTSLIADSTSKTYNVTIPAEDVILTANGTINTYTITYDLTGGALETGKTNPATYTVETESFTLNNPRKVGYTFVGWTGSNVTSANKTVTIEQGSTGDKTYTANWTEISYTITYDLTGGNLAEEVTNKEEYTTETESFTLNNPTKVGYTFVGWTGSNVTSANKTVTIEQGSTGDKTYTANWTANTDTKYTVETYEMNLNGEYVKVNTEEKAGETDTEVSAEIITKEGFTYEESLSTPNGTIAPDGSTVLKVYYSRNKYTLSVANGIGIENATGAGNYYYGATVTINAEVKEGYTWSKWTSSSTKISESINKEYAITIPAEDVILTANGTINTYTITYDLTGGALETGKTNPATYTVETENFTLNNPSKVGYTFAGWTGSNGENQEATVTIEQGSIGDKTYTANWTEISYTITYDLTGGNLAEGVTNKEEYTIETESFTLNNPTKVGYTFVGWTGSNVTSANKTVTIEQGSTGDKTYTANWTANTDTKYTVETYEMNLNGEYVKVNTEEKAGETDTEVSAEIITKEGFTYEESLSTPNGTIAPDGSTVLKVYYSRNKYTLSVANGIGIENATGAGNYYYGATVTINAEVKEGYTWSKWTSNSDKIQESTNKEYTITIPAEDVTLTANGTINTYTITYDLTGGALETGKTNPATYTVETESFTLNNPRKVGYTFVGWTGSNVTSANKTVTIEQGSTGDKTYTANWTANTDTKYTVETYEMNLNGEYVKVNTEEKAGETDTEVSAEIITKEGFTYEESLSTPNGTIAPDGSTVLKVYYSRNKYTLSVANGIGIENATGAGNYYYGATVTINAEVKEGYTWSKWTSNSDKIQESTDKEYTITIPAEDVTLIANGTINTYTITYDLTGGNLAEGVTNKEEYTVETESFTLNNPIKTGYIFAGWTGSNGETANTVVTIEKGSTGNKTYTANWRESSGIIYKEQTYEMNLNGDYVKVKEDEKDGTTGATVNMSTVAREGFTYEESLSTPNGTIAPDGSTVLKVYYSRNKYTLSVANGIGIENATGAGNYYYGATVTINAEVKEGYTWSKWTSSSTKISESINKEYAITIPAEDVILTANGTINTYTITYDLTGGALETGKTNPATYTVETENFTLNNPSKVGYTFAGWTGSNGETAQTTVTIAKGSTENKTYTANWTEIKYTITYNLNGGTVTENPATYTITTESFTLNNPTKVGYTFAGWTGSNGETAQTTVTIAKGSTENKTYTANWTINAYTLTINPNGGTWGGATTNSTAKQNYLTTKKIAVPTRTGYTFAGWTLTGAGSITKTTPLATAEQTYAYGAGDATLTANWTVNKYTLARTAETGGTVSGNSGNIAYGTSRTVTATASTGYTFAGWYEGETKVSSNASYTFTMPAKNYTLVAKFTAISYTITYDLAGGTLETGKTNPATYTVETENFTLNNPSKVGYTFVGWTGNNGETAQTTVTISKGSTENKAYIANWKEIEYTITYNLDGGTVTGNPTTYTITTESFTLNNPSKVGYTFAGWAGSNGTTAQTTVTISKGSTENKTYTANWTVNKYTLTRTAETGGNVSGATGSIEYGKSTTVTAIANTGYTFAGWYEGTSKVSSNASYTFTMPAKNYTLVAKFTAISYTITYDLVGGSLETGKTNPTTYTIITENFTLNNPVKTGYTFTGWTGSNGTTAQTTVTISKGSVGNKTYTANWTINSYELTINPNGGTWGGVTTNSTAKQNYLTTKKIAVPSRIGYTFTGWKLTGAGSITEIAPISTTEQTYTYGAGNATLTANWTVNKYTLTRTAETGGNVSGTTGSVAYGTNVTLTATANAGYTFKGWYEGTTQISTDVNYTFNMPAKEYTIIAKFEEKDMKIVMDQDIKTARNTKETGTINGVEAGPIQVTIKYEDNELQKQYKKQNDSEWITVNTTTATIDITENTTILARYYNGINELKLTKYKIENVDNVAPKITSKDATRNSRIITATMSGTDESGILRYEYSLDGENYQTSNKITLTKGGDITVYFKAIDIAGNETIETMEMSIPTIKFTNGYFVSISGENATKESQANIPANVTITISVTSGGGCSVSSCSSTPGSSNASFENTTIITSEANSTKNATYTTTRSGTLKLSATGTSHVHTSGGVTIGGGGRRWFSNCSKHYR